MTLFMYTAACLAALAAIAIAALLLYRKVYKGRRLRKARRLIDSGGMAQIVNWRESDRLAYDWLLAEASKSGNRKAMKELTGIGRPPYISSVKHDKTISASLIETYVNQLNAPQGKTLIWLEQSAHLNAWSDSRLVERHLIQIAKQSTVAGQTAVFFAHLLLVFTFFWLYAAQGSSNGLLGQLAMIFGVIGTIIVTAIVYVEIAGAAGADVEHTVFESSVPSAINSFGPLLFVVGMLLAGLSVMRAKKLPFGGGALLLIGTLVFAAGSFAGDAAPIVSVIGAVFTGGGFIRLGSAPANGRYER